MNDECTNLKKLVFPKVVQSITFGFFDTDLIGKFSNTPYRLVLDWFSQLSIERYVVLALLPWDNKTVLVYKLY